MIKRRRSRRMRRRSSESSTFHHPLTFPHNWLILEKSFHPPHLLTILIRHLCKMILKLNTVIIMLHYYGERLSANLICCFLGKSQMNSNNSKSSRLEFGEALTTTKTQTDNCRRYPDFF